MANKMDQAQRTFGSICVFCGSSSGYRQVYAVAAAQLGREIANANIRLVFGGGHVGLMGVLADSVLAAGRQAVGVMPRALVEKEIAHKGLTRLHVVESMHERKSLMSDLADAFILLPGGFGSWEEFCEIVTWFQLGIHKKPCGILNIDGYYDSLLAQAAHAVSEGFLRPAYVEMLVVDNHPGELLRKLSMVAVPTETKWINQQER